MNSLVCYPVEVAAARRWLAGSDADPDLLDAVVPSSPLLYVARMWGRQQWRDLLAALRLSGAEALCFRTRCPGLVRLAQRCGAIVTYREPDGAARWFGPCQPLAVLIGRLSRIYGQ